MPAPGAGRPRSEVKRTAGATFPRRFFEPPKPQFNGDAPRRAMSSEACRLGWRPSVDQRVGTIFVRNVLRLIPRRREAWT
jgi:hypothetical protein